MDELKSDLTPIKVTVTVVAYSSDEIVRACLDSLLNQEIQTDKYDVFYRLLINNKEKISPESFHDDYPSFEIIVPNRNVGYAGAISSAWKNSESDIIIVTNDDLEFEPGWLNGLLSPFSDDNIFATTCSVINEDEIEEISNGSLNPIGIRIPDVFPDRTRVLFPSGAAFAFRKDDVEPVDASYFLYFEDVFLGLQARLRGFDIQMNPDSKVHHKNQFSTSTMGKRQLHYYQERNRLANIYHIFEGWTLFKLSPYFIIDFLIRLLQILTFRKRPDAILLAWLYYITHVGTTIFKRIKIGDVRKVKDREILSYMSGKVLPDSNAFNKALNRLFLGYAKLVGLNFAEIDHDA